MGFWAWDATQLYTLNTFVGEFLEVEGGTGMFAFCGLLQPEVWSSGFPLLLFVIIGLVRFAQHLKALRDESIILVGKHVDLCGSGLQRSQR